jgi:hypothetical protein
MEEMQRLERYHTTSDRLSLPPFGGTKHVKQKTKRENFPADVIRLLKKWLLENFKDPYPSAEVKMALAEQTNLTYEQVQHWFVNARMRIWRPLLKKRMESQALESRQGGGSGYPRKASQQPNTHRLAMAGSTHGSRSRKSSAPRRTKPNHGGIREDRDEYLPPPRRVVKHPPQPQAQQSPPLSSQVSTQLPAQMPPLELQLPDFNDMNSHPPWMRVPLALGGTKCQELELEK